MSLKVIASVRPTDVASGVRSARRAALAGADWVELRLDDWPPDADVGRLVAAMSLPVLVACRLPRDHGSFRGTPDERRALLASALQAGASGVDLEDWETWAPDPPPRLLVRSFHDWQGVPADLTAIRDRLLERGADLAKVVVTADDPAAAAPVLDLLAATDQRREPTVAFAMGEASWPTRVLAVALGAGAIYASVESGAETAPGQVPVELLVGPYRVREIGPSTQLLGLLGQPALDSLGPWLHNRAMRRLGVDGVYLPLQTDRPWDVVTMLPAARRRGFSVTAPHKEAVLGLCHRLDDVASAASAVNTLTFPAGGQCVGHNTDAAGVIGALRRAGLGPGAGEPAVVLGLGGAARAAVVALLRLGYRATMLGRSPQRAESFAARAGVEVRALSAEALSALEPRIVVHATPVGGPADPEQRLLPSWTPRPGTFVLDMVYRPRRTRLLRDAERAGAVPVSGRAMFLTQAAEQLELFWGQRLSEDELERFAP